MISDDSFETPFDTQADTESASPADSPAADSLQRDRFADPDAQAAQEAWDQDRKQPVSGDREPASEFAPAAPGGDEDEGPLAELAQPFVGQWNRLISTTNWEKGRIINEWRQALIDSGADASEYSDEAWVRRVGGVTAPHVGRLRRVHDRFAESYESYDGLYWSHFLAALDWDDAPLWLEGAAREGWSVAAMRQQRWQAHGAVESQRPTASEVIEVDTDEDVVLPAQGGGRTKEYEDQPGGVATGPVYDDPDFGDEEELTALSGAQEPSSANGAGSVEERAGAEPASPVQPFSGLPELPDDVADAIEQLKLAVLRHKTAGWQNVTAETVQKYLDAMGILVRT